jgi:rod shape determining protein RodA
MFKLKTLDWSLVVITLVLAVISVATIYTITYVGVGNKLALSQMVFFGIGFGLFALFTMIDYRHYRSLAWVLFGTGVLLLVPMIPIWSHKLPFVICEFNACRWLDLGFFRFQTSEAFKIIILILLSALFAGRNSRYTIWQLLGYALLLLVPAFMILEQPDLGTASVVFSCGMVLFLLARFPVWVWISAIVVAIIAAPLVWSNLKPYQKQRIEVFLNPDSDPTRTGYNVRQAEIAIGSGGLWGRGLGQGSQSQLNFLPVAHTDFIFAGYAEATGYVGVVFLLGVMFFLVWRAIAIAELSKDAFGRFLAFGIAAMFTVQICINISMNIRLAPVTGVTLPLVSYGGTSLFINMIALGILQSIVMRHKTITFS